MIIRILLATALLGAATSLAAQPALVLGMDSVTPGERAIVPINYRGTGSGVVRFSAELQFNSALYSSAAVGCPTPPATGLAVDCRIVSEGVVRIAANTQPATEIGDFNLGALALTVDLRTAPDPGYPVVIAAESYFDAGGNPVDANGSVGGTVQVRPPPARQSIVRSRGLRGNALIFPYYTARGGQHSVLIVSNVSPNAKVIRLNVREGLNGRSLISQNFPGGTAQGLNLYIGAGETRRVVIRPDPDTNGALLLAGGCTVPQIPAMGLPLSNAGFADDPAPQGPRRTQEGFITMLAMADLGGQAAADLQAGDCAAINLRWAPGNTWDVDPEVDTQAPLGDISGLLSIRGLDGRVAFDYGATALRGFTEGNGHTSPASEYSLNHGRTQAVVPDSGSLLPLRYNTSAEAVSATLMQTELLLPVRSSGVQWIIAFPTKAWFTDPARAIAMPPVNPFSSTFGAGGACEPARLLPLSVNATADLCWHTNVLPFNDRMLLDSDTQAPSVDRAVDEFGLVRFPLTPGLTDLDNGATLEGRPVLGLAIPFRDGAAPRTDRLQFDQVIAKGTAAGEQAGAEVFVNGRLVFVGVPGADGGRGQVFVFRRHGTVMVPEATLTPPAELSVAEFGARIDAEGALAVIGAPGTPVAGKGTATNQMQAAIYERLSGNWSVKQTFETTDISDDGFGTAVAIDGTTVAFGAPGDDTMGEDAGAVYVYDVDGNLFNTVLPMDTSQTGKFGTSLDVDDGILAVGSPDATTASQQSGTVSVYSQILGNLTGVGTLASDAPTDGDAFGTAVSMSGTMLAIGAPGTNGGEDGEDDNSGSIELWDFDGDNYVNTTDITPDDAGYGAQFGQALILSRLGLVAGAPGALGAAGASGAIYEYEFAEEQVFLNGRTSPDETDISGYGSSVGSDGEVTVIGAPSTADEAGAAIVVVDAQTLFFDDFETEID